jgi:hypothetical protein
VELKAVAIRHKHVIAGWNHGKFETAVRFRIAHVALDRAQARFAVYWPQMHDSFLDRLTGDGVRHTACDDTLIVLSGLRGKRKARQKEEEKGRQHRWY